MTGLDDIYACYEILQSSGEQATKLSAYQKLMEHMSSGESKEKRLAAKFLTQFCSQFSTESEKVFDLLLDLCDTAVDLQQAPGGNDDPEVSALRCATVLELRHLCSHYPQFINKSVIVFTQMLSHVRNNQETHVFQTQMNELLHANSIETMKGILKHLHNTAVPTEDNRQPDEIPLICQILCQVLKRLSNNNTTIPAAIEELVQQELLSIMDKATDHEYAAYLDVMSHLSSMNTLSARRKVIENLTDILLKSHGQLNITSSSCVDNFLSCLDRVIPLLSKNVQTRGLMNILLDSVKSITEAKNDSKSLKLLQHLAVLSNYAGPIVCPIVQPAAVAASSTDSSGDVEDFESKAKAQCSTHFLSLVSALDSVLPHPPSETQQSTESDATEVSDVTTNPAPPAAVIATTTTAAAVDDTIFPILECLLLTLYQLASRCWNSIWNDELPAYSALTLLRPRLQFTALSVKQLVKDKTLNDKYKQVFVNLQSLLLEFLRPKLTYRSTVILSPSWTNAAVAKPVNMKSPSTDVAVKRINPISLSGSSTNGSGANVSITTPTKKRFSTEIYRPTGKFENNLGPIPGSPQNNATTNANNNNNSNNGFRFGGGRSNGGFYRRGNAPYHRY